jgi:hypothetical protein
LGEKRVKRGRFKKLFEKKVVVYFNILLLFLNIIGVDFMEQSPSAKLQFIVGDIGYAFNNDIGIFYDFIGKIYIETGFRLRSEVLSVTV